MTPQKTALVTGVVRFINSNLLEALLKLHSKEAKISPCSPAGGGAPRKLMGSRCINALGWQAKVGLEDGLAKAYEVFLQAP